MTVETKKHALLCLGQTFRPCPSGEATHIECKLLLGRVLVMEGERGETSVVAAADATPAEQVDELPFPLPATGLLKGVTAVLCFVLAPAGTIAELPPCQRGSTNHAPGRALRNHGVAPP